MLKILKKVLKTVTGFVVIVVQKILITTLLSLLYIIGFGLMFFFALFFKRSIFSDLKFKKSGGNRSYWRDAKEYDTDIDDCIRQS